MANLPEKNITTVDKITSIPSNTNLYINANGEFRQATIDDVLKASPVIADSITNQYKNASGSPILLTDSAKGVVIDFDVKGRSTQDGEPTPTEPITPKSVGDMGYFDGELLNGIYSNGVHGNLANYVCSKNRIPCQPNDKIEVTYDGACNVVYAFFYDENGAYLSHKDIASNKLTTQAIANAYSFHIGVYNANGLTVATAKHICVTINDKHALIVDSVGKNELENTATSQMMNGVVFTVNEDKSVTINTNGTTSAVTSILLGTYTFKANESYILSGQKTNTLLTFGKISDGSGLVVFDSTVYTPTEDITLYARLLVDKGKTVNDTIYPMLRLASVTDATYEPYKKSRKYIPISAPLRGIGEVTDVVSLSECKVDRKFIKVVFDGSDDESWQLNSAYTNTNLFRIYPPIKAKTSSVICSHFKYNSGIGGDDFEHIRVSGDATPIIAIWVNKTKIATVDEWKAWLSANPITVIYELAEPTTESIEPIDVDTFEGVTHISASDDADMEVEYPASKVAGIASIGWSKGRRAEYDLEQLKVQMLALQTTIVSTV